VRAGTCHVSRMPFCSSRVARAERADVLTC
jgi:hypothetical protein